MERLLRRQRFLSQFSRSLLLGYCIVLSSYPLTASALLLFLSESAELTDSVSHNATALPGPPSKPEVTDVTKSSVSLSWRPGSEDASLTSAYVIEAFGYVRASRIGFWYSVSSALHAHGTDVVG